ncbi:hypothetical protein L4C36_11110 [Photobacterium japonica]|uniref:hypothetical protein n=1 Tax=Photobacterium japonica TaxID=2910235 RepID=UPI003D146CD9
MSTCLHGGMRRLKYLRICLYLLIGGVCSSVWSVHADTMDVRCDIYPHGASEPAGQYFCVFSQRQGHVTLDRSDGVNYDFIPVGNTPGNYQDNHGQPVYRQSGLGNDGLIFKLKEESVYVYWDTSGLE